MLKNIVQLTVQVGEKAFHLLCDPDAPLNHVKEALFQFSKIVGDIENRAQNAANSVSQEKQEDASEAKPEGTE